ncbi:hypothetical protein K431DRAFT_124620 [Polychaeton citri CBS 116435]|uniref:Yeast cell wall synthesis Kre9/Knh1-like N-terminal domain-containing protein n=1 Tax=Polychaeton citri CBS 116435 TaxID=1314669 RepID=A0A9P4Q2Z6_9PEZI|nr:hypothetical protein K431DRAFT_124620 [Polychaeton citri CBS 116435]
MMFLRSSIVAFVGAPLVALAQNANPFSVPSGGFSAVAGESLELNWNPTTDGTVTLVLRSGASSNLNQGSIIEANIDNSGSYTWDVPSGTVRGSDYTIEIVSDTDTSEVNYTPPFVIDSNVTGSPTSQLSSISLVAVTSLRPSSTASPSSSASNSPSTVSSTVDSSVSTSIPSSSESVTLISGSSGSAVPTGSSTATSSGESSSTTSAGSTDSSSSTTGAAFQSQTDNVAPRATVVAGLLGAIALGALAL